MTNFEWLLENEREKVIKALSYSSAVDKEGNFDLCRSLGCSDCHFYTSRGQGFYGCLPEVIKWLNSEREEKEK